MLKQIIICSKFAILKIKTILNRNASCNVDEQTTIYCTYGVKLTAYFIASLGNDKESYLDMLHTK